MNKKAISWLIIAYLCGLCLLGTSRAWAADGATAGETIEGLLGRLELQDLEAFSEEVGREVSPYLPDLPEMNLRSILAGLRAGEPVIDPRSLFAAACHFLWAEILANTKVMGELLVLAILCSVLENLSAAFERRTVAELAHLVVLLALIVLAIGSFSVAMQAGRQTVDRMVSFMQALLPVLLTLTAAMGGMVSVAILHPLALGSLTLGGTLVKDVVIPLLYMSAVLNIVGRLSERFRVSRMADMMKNFSMISLGLCVTVAVGILTVQSTAGRAADSVTLRTLKFASTTFVPVIGKTLTDAVEVVASTSGLVLSAANVLAFLAMLGIVLFPVLKIAVLALIYHLTAALIQPFGDSRVSDTLNAMGGTLGMTFAAVVAVAIFCFLVSSLVVGLGNVRTLW